MHERVEREWVLKLYLGSNPDSAVAGYETWATSFSLCEHQFSHLKMK